MLGSWTADGGSAGAAVRESESLITDGYPGFLPRYIDAPRAR
ncbi:glutathionylspermidine synthase family protein [Micromonospora globispora]|nr:glutathionylspermidine synthase family protein [Micromonospora globispora]